MSYGPPPGSPGSPYPRPFGMPEPPAPTPRGPGLWFWIRHAILMPFRLMGLLILLALLIPGLFKMWPLPSAASRGQVDLDLLTLRVLDRSRAITPFRPLGDYNRGLQQVADFLPDRSITQLILQDLTLRGYWVRAVNRTTASPPEGGYVHTIEYSDGSTKVVKTVTPHYTMERIELDDAKRNIRKLFPSKKSHEEILQWGQALHWTTWYGVQSTRTVPISLIPSPAEGTEDEHYWLAWRALVGDSPDNGADLFRLNELFQEAFPDEDEFETAINWGKTLYKRMEQEFLAYQTYIQAQSGFQPGELTELNTYTLMKRVLPPNTGWIHAWLVYRYFGLTPASREIAQKRWEESFPPTHREQVLAYGHRVEDERRAANEPLPPIGETLPWVCAVERLVGSDPYGQRCRDIARQLTSDRGARSLEDALMTVNPNDDMFYLEASQDRLELLTSVDRGNTVAGRLQRVGSPMLYILVIALAIRTLISWGLARWLLDDLSMRRYEIHLNMRGHPPIWLRAMSILGFGLIGAMIAPMTLSESIRLQIDHFGDLFLGALLATMLGGLLIGAIRETLAVVLTGLGFDIEKVWLDEALGILIGIIVLGLFGNPMIAIGLYALSDFIPVVLTWLVRRQKPMATEDHWNDGSGVPAPNKGSGGFPSPTKGSSGGFPAPPKGSGGFPPPPKGSGGFPPPPMRSPFD